MFMLLRMLKPHAACYNRGTPSANVLETLISLSLSQDSLLTK